MGRRHTSASIATMISTARKRWKENPAKFIWVTEKPRVVYPWHLWLDGRTWLLFQHNDWNQQHATTMQNMIREAALRYQVRVVTKRHPSGQGIYLQSMAKYRTSRKFVESMLRAEDDFWERVDLDEGRRLTGRPGPRDYWENQYHWMPDQWIGVSGRKVTRAKTSREQQNFTTHLLPQRWRRADATTRGDPGVVVDEDLRGSVPAELDAPVADLDALEAARGTSSLSEAAQANPLIAESHPPVPSSSELDDPRGEDG